MKKRLSKTLAAAGVASRRAAEELIFQGRVNVNGKQTKVPQTLVDPQKDRIQVDGKLIAKEEKKVYFILNKPAGYLCSDKRMSPTSKLVMDLFQGLPYRLFTVGRLDKDTTGLLLVTNDGTFANQIIHPSYGISKEYVAKVSSEIQAEHLEALSEGTVIERTKIKPLSVKKVRRGTVKIVVGEGKKREVRLLLESVGLEVIELARVRIGSLLLGKLPLGAWQELPRTELEKVFPHLVAKDPA